MDTRYAEQMEELRALARTARLRARPDGRATWEEIFQRLDNNGAFGDGLTAAYTADDLLLILEALEITLGSLDRPEEGTAEHLSALIEKTTAMRRTAAHTAEVGTHATAIMAQIDEDIRDGFSWGKQIPADVGSFSLLHDYCDANMYLLDGVPQGDMSWDAYMDLLNEVCCEVDARLAERSAKMHAAAKAFIA
jgi:hypothetical protein